MPLDIDLNMPLHIDLNLPYNDSEVVDSTVPMIKCNTTYPIASESNDSTTVSIDMNFSISEDNDEGHDTLNDGRCDEEYHEIASETLEAQHALNEVDSHTEVENIVSHEAEPSQRKRSFLNNIQRNVIAQVLINESHDGKLKRGIVQRLALYYSVSIYVIYRIWKQIRETGDACHKKTKNCGRKRVEIDIEKVREVELSKRGSYRALGRVLGVNKNKLLRYKQEGILRRHTSSLKPHLKEDNMKACLRFCLSMLEESSIPHNPMFKSMYNVVHIDEKWFHMTQKTKKYYLLADEDDPYRTCKNKNNINKVMFLVAVARPRFDDDGNETFSGKIGMFPLVEQVPAIRSSVNRPAGTLVTKPITSITKEVSRRFLINKVLPAIKEKWPREYARETIYIQQDNAPCHVPINDKDFCTAASEGGFDIHLTCQPPNSPDLNILDFGFFNAIQSLQQTEVAKTADELIQIAQKSFDDFSTQDSNKFFLSLQATMIEIMKVKGSGNYKVPHMNKDAILNRDDKLPIQLQCDGELVQETFEYLHNVG